MTDPGPPLHVAIIIQARMGASRLPGKPLKEVLGKPLLFYLIERLKSCKNVNDIVIATTTLQKDQVLVDYAKSLGVKVVIGEEDNVLGRFGLANQTAKADVIVRITADCPLTDPELIDAMVAEFISKYPHLDYLSNTLKRTYPRGLDVEIFSKEALHRGLLEATTAFEQEHVTPYFYQHPEKFHLANFPCKENHSRHRWTVDTEEDFTLVKKIIEALYPAKKQFDFQDMLHLIHQHPEWEDINRHIKQKTV